MPAIKVNVVYYNFLYREACMCHGRAANVLAARVPMHAGCPRSEYIMRC